MANKLLEEKSLIVKKITEISGLSFSKIKKIEASLEKE